MRTALDEAVLFVNAGGNPRAGWARMNVEFARTLAQDGITSLRIDVAGLGDSPPVAGRRSQIMYDDAPRRDVGCAVDALLAAGFSRITIVGLCSGAHLAFHTAVEHPGVTGFVLVNLQKFIWRPSDRFEVVLRQAYRSNEHYKAAVWRGATWRRLLHGEINVIGIARTITRRLSRTFANRLASAGRHFGLIDDDTAKVRRWFRRLDERGVRGLVIYSAEDGGLDELYLHMGAQARDLLRLPNMSMCILEGADHNVTPSWARSLLATHLRCFLAGAAASAPEHMRSAAQ
jgi:pimeloyl-ACP methyl ester carboxylesterase